MRVMLDHNVPHKLSRSLAGHDVKTADEMGWAQLGNGALLAAAETAGFDVMVTGDKNLSYQQNLKSRKLALIVLSTSRWKILQENSQLVVEAINAAKLGSFQVVVLETSPTRRVPPS